MILADVFYRCAALRYWLSATAISGTPCSFRQPKHKLQGPGCAADRASRSDDETRGKRTDRACSYLAAFPGFHCPLKLTIYRSKLNWRNRQTSPRQLTSPARFLCSFLFQKKARIPDPKCIPLYSSSCSNSFSCALKKRWYARTFFSLVQGLTWGGSLSRS